MKEHLIFFDAECPLCHRAVKHIIALDKEKKVVFAPLKGKTAQELLRKSLGKLTKANTIILVENYQSEMRRFWIRSKAICRLYWLLGHKAKGAFCFMPSFLGDWVYRWVAHHRHQFKLQMPEISHPERFLP